MNTFSELESSLSNYIKGIVLLCAHGVIALSIAGCGHSNEPGMGITTRPCERATVGGDGLSDVDPPAGRENEAVFEVDLEAATKAIIDSNPDAWSEIRETLSSGKNPFDPNTVKRHKRWAQMSSLAPGAFALLVRALAVEEGNAVPFSRAVVIADYVWKSQPHVCGLIKMELFSSPFTEGAIQELCLHPDVFAAPFARHIWSYAEDQLDRVGEPYREIVRANARMLSGKANASDVTMLLAALDEAGWEPSLALTRFILAHASKAVIRAWDQGIAELIASKRPDLTSSDGSILGILAVSELFTHGYKVAFVNYVKGKQRLEDIHIADITMVEQISACVLCASAPALMVKDVYLSSRAAEAKEDALGFMNFILSPEFEMARWHDGLQLWVDKRA